MNSTTYVFQLCAREIAGRSIASVHNFAFPVKNLSAAQQNLDATLEENA